MWITSLPPFVPFFIAALLAGFTRGWLRSGLILLLPVLSFINLWFTQEGTYGHYQLLHFQLSLFAVDGLSLLFGYLFHIAAILAIIYSLHVRDSLQQVSSLLYAGSALGAVFAGDLITLFIFWELLALTSVFLIWARRSERAYHAGMRYLLVSIVSGLLLLIGIIVYSQQNGGDLSLGYIGLEGLHGWLIFLGLGIKCGFPLLHSWIVDAYPEATPTGTVFLSAFTTKAAIYVLARTYPGTEMLIYIGAVMACFPIFFAIIENDLRRVLSYSLISQLGYMVVGVGIGSTLAINGAAATAFNHVLYKSLLLMSMGAVLHSAGTTAASHLGGLYKSMPKTAGLTLIGTASIAAFPLFNGFVSKALIMSAVLYNGNEHVWLALMFASAGALLYVGIKVPFFAFFAKDAGIEAREAPGNMLLAMSLTALLCIVIGIFPGLLYGLLPYEVDYNPYDVTHVLTQLQLLFFSALVFVVLYLKGLYPKPQPGSMLLDIDWLYRKPLPALWRLLSQGIIAASAAFRGGSMGILRLIMARATDLHNAQGLMSRSWSTGAIAVWIVALLALYLLLGYIGLRS